MERIIIIGGVAAGMSAASKIRRMNPKIQTDVYTDEYYVSYSGCSLPYYAQGVIEETSSMIVRKPEKFIEQGINLYMGHTVKSIMPENKEIRVLFPNGKVAIEKYDKLIIATGARPIVPNIDGIDLKNVFTVNRIDDVVNIRSLLRAGGIKNAVVVGAGFIGIEMVEALSEYGTNIHVIELAPQILSAFDEDIAGIAEEYLKGRGVNFYKNDALGSISGNGHVTHVSTTKDTLPADIVILSIGVIPNTELVSGSGISLGSKNAIAVNLHMETNVKDVYAAGDCAETFNPLYGDYVYLPLGTTANKQGRIAGENAAGGKAVFHGSIGTAIFKVIDMEASRTGLCSTEAEKLSKKIWSVMVKTETIAHSYPGNGPCHVKLIMEQGTNKIVGGQIFGSKSSAKRIDTIAAMIQMEATPEDLAKLDLAYAPPFAPVWDPLLVAANAALQKMK